MSYRILEPSLRNTFPKIWRGFDLRGMKAGQRLIGCEHCGVQMDHADAYVNQCPNCTGRLSLFIVTKEDVSAVANPLLSYNELTKLDIGFRSVNRPNEP